jgi:hypothetical protein
MAKTTRSISQTQIENHGKLGKRIEIGSTAHVSLNKPGMKCEWFVPTIQCIIGIGKDHVGYLIMDEDAWKALKKGQKINITSIKQFTKKFL